MGYSIARTEWPSYLIFEAKKQLIESLFLTLDDTSSGAGDRLADEIFAIDGVFNGSHAATGTEGIRRCRDQAWKVIRKRRHEILKVYIADTEAADLLLLGKVRAELQNGRAITSDFAARVVLENAETNRPKVKLYQVFVDHAPLMKAAQEQ
ncbi:hypothetical protein DL98DRAFT_540740 [Cadophora sp. DSE1049]|nr:hypothetical protein DL98DRAFT_540740 [Cadophora sp. DSE1049]